MSLPFSSETVASIAGAVLSLFFAYVPKLDAWYAALDATKKRLIMAGMLLVVTVALVVNGCRADAACYSSSAEQAVRILFAALVVNQGTYPLLPRPKYQARHDDGRPRYK